MAKSPWNLQEANAALDEAFAEIEASRAHFAVKRTQARRPGCSWSDEP